jgi:uncharacterized membrane protein YvbJ
LLVSAGSINTWVQGGNAEDVKDRVSMKARYFCEACGAEVKAGASTCPSCGSLFTAVRCPECGYEGRAPEFRSGCPVCGYHGKPNESASNTSAGRAKKKPLMPPGFYRAAIVVLGALILGLIAILVLQS